VAVVPVVVARRPLAASLAAALTARWIVRLAHGLPLALLRA
jgi:hypothetical protein